MPRPLRNSSSIGRDSSMTCCRSMTAWFVRRSAGMIPRGGDPAGGGPVSRGAAGEGGGRGAAARQGSLLQLGYVRIMRNHRGSMANEPEEDRLNESKQDRLSELSRHYDTLLWT